MKVNTFLILLFSFVVGFLLVPSNPVTSEFVGKIIMLVVFGITLWIATDPQNEKDETELRDMEE